MSIKSIKAQAWYVDFIVGLLIFLFTVAVYLTYTSNLQQQDNGNLDILLKDAKGISSTLSLKGYPEGWDNSTVTIIGIADDQEVNGTKMKYFSRLNYTATKKSFATPYDYFVYFENSGGDVINVNGVCGVGNSAVNTSYKIKSAYYYSTPSGSFLKDFMLQNFDADVYYNDIAGLSNKLSSYGFVVMEHSLLSASEFSTYKARIENYSSSGGLLMISGELAAPATNNMIGVDFKTKSGQSSSQRTAIINNTDTYISFTPGQSTVFNQYYYVENTSASEFYVIGTFNQTDDKAIAKWKYGNGTNYFFSDFDVSYFSGDFVGIVEDAAKGLIGGTCNPINLSGISAKNFVKTERYLNYNSRAIRMVVYLWQ